MKNIFFLLLAAPALVLAQGKQAIELQPFAPGETLHTGSVFYVNGKCGDSGVSIIGIQSDPKRGDSFLTDPLSEPNILVDNGVEKMAYDYALSDRNSVRCVNTKSGFKLVVRSQCATPGCGDEIDFLVIDMKTLQTHPDRSSSEQCDAKCVNKVLGFKYAK